MSTHLAGKVAIVTGGSRGIGLAIAAALVDAQARVVIAAREEASLARAAERLATSTGGARDRLATVAVDVRDYDQVARLMDAAVARFGGLDVLVNNAGVGGFSEVASQPLEEWRAIIETNLTGVFYCCRAAIPPLRRRGGGWIINISSLAGKNPFAGAAGYCASKAGLNAFSEALMQELRYDDIRVSYILPGSVRTGFGGHADGSEASWKLAPDDIARVVVDLVGHDRRSLPSRIELRPSKPRK